MAFLGDMCLLGFEIERIVAARQQAAFGRLLGAVNQYDIGVAFLGQCHGLVQRHLLVAPVG
jgi:hypothetical protein